ncbi:MAG: phosphate ABC transporter permease subunit PstC [Gammaproteobacteria bacterium]|jgi:phosphate transport system permease protein|nr:phosphate ABC transporter permease subunit PstC [Gammaproteobacteria bacterium]
MQTLYLFLVLLLLATLVYHFGRKRAIAVAGGQDWVQSLHSLPSYYGLYAAVWAALPAMLLLGLWAAFQDTILATLITGELTAGELKGQRLEFLINDIKALTRGGLAARDASPELRAVAETYARYQQLSQILIWVLVLGLALGGGSLALKATHPELRARNHVESTVLVILVVFSSIAILTTFGIVLSVLFESIRFFQKVSWQEFLFGLHWSPQIALRADQVAASGAFGAVPLFAGTMLISVIAMALAVPIGLMSAIYLSEYAPRVVRAWAKPTLEVLAGIPTVVYGFFAALTVAPAIRDLGTSVGLDVSSESGLAAGLVMGVMIIPLVSSLSDDVINAVPQSMRDGALALGATPSETIKRVVLPAALPGIVGGILLAVSRAIGETMIVVMAAGVAANLTANPLESVTTVTVQIVVLLTGDQEFDSAKTLAAFALGLTLFVVTLTLNVIALHIVRKYREQYE